MDPPMGGGVVKDIRQPLIRVVIKIICQLLPKTALYYHKRDIFLLIVLVLHNIFLKLTKYSYFLNHSNIF